MNLHSNIKLFEQTVRATAGNVNIKPEFIEKDYWITFVLHQLSITAFASETVFKGGTSLSKGFNLIHRFSEDIDLAILNTQNYTGNQIKNKITGIEKQITKQLTEVTDKSLTSKGSRYRKSVFTYPAIDKTHNNRLIVEINSFANPYPYQTLPIRSMIFDFLDNTGNHALIDEYKLYPFQINVLDKKQTLLEKLVSLFRHSFYADYSTAIAGKIRHFYDLYFLVNDAECQKFIQRKSFKEDLLNLWQHDKQIFDEPHGWKEKDLNDSPLAKNFDAVWEKVKTKYKNELTALSFREIPDEKDIAENFNVLLSKINTWQRR
ncbi:MAG: nucleotidyl transferase AbiEii/AbiGii toxin family protein [Bacteroidales bacterium]